MPSGIARIVASIRSAMPSGGANAVSLITNVCATTGTIARRLRSTRCPRNACRTISILRVRSACEYDLVMTAMIGTDFHIAIELEKLWIVSGNSFAAVPSTQNQITLMRLFSLPSCALNRDHLRTAWIARRLLIGEGSNPMESMTRNGTDGLP